MRVGIIGGGISGLTLHHYLRQQGVESTVFEKTAEPGGVIKTIQHDGHVLELGPQRARLTPSIHDLITDVEIEDQIIHAPDVPLFVYRDGKQRLVPTTVHEAIATDLISWRGKFRVLLEPFADPPKQNETVQEYLTRAFGHEVADYFIGPLYGGLYGSHPDEMYVEHSLARALDNLGVSRSVLIHVVKSLIHRRSQPSVGSFEEGLQTLPEALSDAHRETVKLNTPVTEIDRMTDDSFHIETPTETIAVDWIVFTTPADITASLLKEIDARSARHLRKLNYNPLAVVHLWSDADLEGAGVQIPFDEPFDVLGCTWNASLLDRSGVYTCYFGGGQAPGIVERPAEELKEIAVREFETITGYDAEPIHSHRIRPGMPAYDTSWTAVDGIDPPRRVTLCTNYTDRAGIPGRVRAAKQLAARLADTR